MSEQPKSYASYVPEQEPIQLSENPDVVTHLDLHRNITVPRYDKEVVAAGRIAFEQPKSVIEDPISIEVRRIGQLLSTLNVVRQQSRTDVREQQTNQSDYTLAA